MENPNRDIANKHVEARRQARLDGICDLMVEYGVTIGDLETYFIDHYRPMAVRAADKRQRRNRANRQVEIARGANATRWARYDALKTSHLKAKAEKAAAIENVPKPKGLTSKSVVDVPPTEGES